MQTSVLQQTPSAAGSRCALCKAESVSELQEEGRSFCCPGCLAVYNILKAKGELAAAQDHPLTKAALRFGILSNHSLFGEKESEESDSSAEERLKLYIDLEGLWCPSCGEIIRLTLFNGPGVSKCVVDFATDLAFIEYNPLLTSKETLFGKIKELGYTPHVIEDSARKKASPALKIRMALASFLAINLMMLSSPIYVSYFVSDIEGFGYLFALLSLVFAAPAVVLALPLFLRCYHQLRFGIVGMEALVTVGVSTAFILSCINLIKGSYHIYFDSMAVVVALVLVGKAIESEAKFSAKESMMRLMRATPKRARKKFAEGEVRFVSIKEVAVGDILVAHVGEKIALDGLVLTGSGAVDESLMTGEARPVSKKEGSRLVGGTFLQAGNFEYRVLEVASRGTLQKLIDTIEDDLGKKLSEVKLIDRISELFVPFAFAVSLAAFAMGSLYSFEEGLERFLSVVLISCPCAIGIAIPIVESALLNALSAAGVLVRNRRALHLIGRESVFLFDKTGTVTEGKFEAVNGLEQFSTKELEVIKALASLSLHPLSLAIYRSINTLPATNVTAEELPGLGLAGHYEGARILMGSSELLRLKGVYTEDMQQENGLATTVWIAIEKEGQRTVRRVLLGDKVKKGMREFICGLKGLTTVLVSGDAEETVKSVAQECGFSSWKSRFNPLEKRMLVEELKEGGDVVAMMGDGINDAPALTSAHIGISVASASDIAISVSDILVTTEKSEALSFMRHLALSAQKIMRQNLFWAFFYNAIGMLLALFGLLNPLYAAFAMAISSLMCVLNAKRI
ncbi:heavy metal translocating P-type ATPase [Estrella lausannensis]|uniref:Heavy metal translocating P-type ATPase n=1 Tax=Estrella lausannensis TaxID=483423 RepID=A0A0H5DP32_9BACT|nr:cation-translocating P-type ATPase [Estrella lausannensis]CRX38102.1 heavy metal translocating P-type ATPase [Estrella lausannensis]